MIIFRSITTLLEVKICCNGLAIKNSFERVIKQRLQADIDDSFSCYSLSFNDKDDIHLTAIGEFLEYVKKIYESMSIMPEYLQCFVQFDVNYVKECYFVQNSAGDRVRNSLFFVKNTIHTFNFY